MTTTTHDASTHERTTGRHEDGPAEHRLREVVPAVVSVALLFGLLMAGAFMLQEVADLGLWLAGR